MSDFVGHVSAKKKERGGEMNLKSVNHLLEKEVQVRIWNLLNEF